MRKAKDDKSTDIKMNVACTPHFQTGRQARENSKTASSILKCAQVLQRLSMAPPDEILSVPEDLGLPADGVLRKLHSAQIDQ